MAISVSAFSRVKNRCFLAKNGRFFSFFREFRSKKVRFWDVTFQKKSVFCTNFLYSDPKWPKSANFAKKKNWTQNRDFGSEYRKFVQKTDFFWNREVQKRRFTFWPLSSFVEFWPIFRFWSKMELFFRKFILDLLSYFKKTQKNVFFLGSKKRQ
jgi:hypothetical protein